LYRIAAFLTEKMSLMTMWCHYIDTTRRVPYCKKV